MHNFSQFCKKLSFWVWACIFSFLLLLLFSSLGLGWGMRFLTPFTTSHALNSHKNKIYYGFKSADDQDDATVDFYWRVQSAGAF